jgi:hypothetical protein
VHGSAVQTALVVAPVMVHASWLTGQPMNLVFGSPLDLFAGDGIAFIGRSVAADGEDADRVGAPCQKRERPTDNGVSLKDQQGNRELNAHCKGKRLDARRSTAAWNTSLMFRRHP